MPKIDSPTVTSGNQERSPRWVTVPDTDLYNFTFPTIRINLTPYGPGRHFVDAITADFIEERIAVKQAEDIRAMRPQQDVTSQRAMNRFGTGAGRGNYVKNPDIEMA